MIGKKQIILHPILFAVFPILFIFSHNRAEALVIGQILLPLAFSVAGTLLLWFVLGVISGEWRKAALIVSLVVLLFFSYGHFHNALTGRTLAGIQLWRHRYLLGAYGLLFLISSV